MTDPTRLRELNELPANSKGRYVLYWMQQSQRTRFNHALEHAITQADELKLPVVVGFGLMDDYPEANARHYAFMLQGIADVKAALNKRNIAFVLRRRNPADVAIELSREAAMVVCDRGYLRHQKQWRDRVADGAKCAAVEIETDVVVPVEVTSDHAEFAARTIRPKIHKLLKSYLVSLASSRPKVKRSPRLQCEEVNDLRADTSVAPVSRFIGGEVAAQKQLKRFLRGKLIGYADGRNEPAGAHTSMLSPYLHFGQISAVEIALAVMRSDAPKKDRDAYLEELVVRRELSMNYCNFQPRYDAYEALPEWARKTLSEHRRDKREYVYTREQLESAHTHDRYWNAAQTEMTSSGFMHNYMRMYWGKKIIEWKRTPQEAYADVLYLNNKYFIDGRDPTSYANVAWLFGLHDRPWGPPRKIFGTVRYMNAAGLERKFDMDAYVKWVATLG